MQADIRRLGGINIYFPFLDQKNGKIASLRQELDWIIVYTLFADRILFPPRSLFSGKFALQNLDDLTNFPILKYLTENGTLITTTTNQNIRDVADLFECYSHLHAHGNFPLNEFSIYSRDDEFQKRVESDYVVDQIKKMDDIENTYREKIYLIASEMPNHINFVSKVVKSLPPGNIELKEKILRVLSAGYFFAGAKGNSAITPPIHNQQPHEYFEFFYSKPLLHYFAIEFQRTIGRPIHTINYKELQKARTNLAIFREQYLAISIKHRVFFENIFIMLSKSHPTMRIRAPILALQATAATSIGLALTPILGPAAFGAAIVGKFAWETVSKGYKINDRFAESMRKILVKAKILSPYTKDILELLESYQKGLGATFPP